MEQAEGERAELAHQAAELASEQATLQEQQQEARTIQDLYLAGKKQAAEAAVPEDLLVRTSLIGTEGHVRERLAALADEVARQRAALEEQRSLIAEAQEKAKASLSLSGAGRLRLPLCCRTEVPNNSA